MLLQNGPEYALKLAALGAPSVQRDAADEYAQYSSAVPRCKASCGFLNDPGAFHQAMSRSPGRERGARYERIGLRTQRDSFPHMRICCEHSWRAGSEESERGFFWDPRISHGYNSE